MKTVLFNDPNLSNNQIFFIMNQIFTHEGLKMEAAFDAADTQSKAASLKPDIILLKNAVDTLQVLKDDPTIKDIPVVVLLPSKSSASYVQKMLDRGAAAALTMDSASILQVIDKINEVLGEPAIIREQ
ncbi:hypothetical protein HYS00_00240 [Candidatus Microgenomates bacterium]|nr:hypothetical protein [Candidatus Microgenomates bacterium]